MCSLFQDVPCEREIFWFVKIDGKKVCLSGVKVTPDFRQGYWSYLQNLVLVIATKPDIWLLLPGGIPPMFGGTTLWVFPDFHGQKARMRSGKNKTAGDSIHAPFYPPNFWRSLFWNLWVKGSVKLTIPKRALAELPGQFFFREVRLG